MQLTDPIFTDETKAREHLEKTRWPHGAVCPHCGVVAQATELKGKAHRPGVYQCNACREQFTVTVGTVFEHSKVPLHKWLLATYLISSSKKGISAHQIGRTLGVTYKTAWFMMHRIRESMRDTSGTQIGGHGKTIEVDETFLGREPDTFVSGKGWRGGSGRKITVTLIERGGRARSVHFENLTKPEIVRALNEANRRSILNTDEAQHYRRLGKEFISHHTVNHSEEEYARGPATTNTVGGYFSIFKRGMKGIYQHSSEAHMHRYLAEFDFRYSNRVALGVDDEMRTNEALRGIEGKRLTYRRTNEARNGQAEGAQALG